MKTGADVNSEKKGHPAIGRPTPLDLAELFVGSGTFSRTLCKLPAKMTKSLLALLPSQGAD